MNVVVAVAEVAELAEDFELEDGEIPERYLDYGLNEWDEYAVEAGVRLAEADVVEDVVAVTVGPERCEETVRQVLAKGADRAVRVWDDALAGRALDPGATARLLAPVVREADADLVLSGVQASDDGFGATGVSLAAELGYEWAAVVNALDVDADAGTASVHRELEGGVEELTEVALPAVLTVQTGLNEPRYASLRGIRQAQSKELAVRSPADLGLDAAAAESALSVGATHRPEGGGETTYFEGDAAEQAAQLAALLRDEGVVGE
ncbi:MAG: electron transfer flavoprotein subunit beta/FixA family protein [Halobacteriaceae archaeon]